MSSNSVTQIPETIFVAPRALTARALRSAPIVPPKLSTRIPTLDGLRGLAVLIVLLGHFYNFAGGLATLEPAHRWLGALVGKVAHEVVIGVDLFFVLSGFLITGILCDAKGTPHFFRNFYMRRVLRIFPLYYGVLFCVLIVLPAVFRPLADTSRDLRTHQLPLWYYGINLPWSIRLPLLCPWVEFSHFWSLAVEEHFYLVWPLLVWLLPRKGLLAASAVGIVSAVAIRSIILAAGAEHRFVYFSACQTDGLAIGAWLALAARAPGGLTVLLPWARRALWIAGAVTALVMFRPRTHPLPGPEDAIKFLAYGVFFGAILVRTLCLSSGALWSRFLGSLPMRSLGKYSYGMYVFHFLVYPFYGKWFPLDVFIGVTRSVILGIPV